LPSRPPKSTSRLCHLAKCKRGDHREQPQRCRCGSPYRQLRPPTLCLGSEMPLGPSWKVTSSCQRITNQQTIFCGSELGSVHRRACVLNSPRGSRIHAQRTGTANKPVLYHTAVSEATSTMRLLSPYQFAIVVSFQTVAGSSATTERFAKRSPLRRGLPNPSRTTHRGRLVEGGVRPKTGDEGDRLPQLAAAL
jgi:hypothetical protein